MMLITRLTFVSSEVVLIAGRCQSEQGFPLLKGAGGASNGICHKIPPD